MNHAKTKTERTVKKIKSTTMMMVPISARTTRSRTVSSCCSSGKNSSSLRRIPATRLYHNYFHSSLAPSLSSCFLLPDRSPPPNRNATTSRRRLFSKDNNFGALPALVRVQAHDGPVVIKRRCYWHSSLLFSSSYHVPHIPLQQQQQQQQRRSFQHRNELFLQGRPPPVLLPTTSRLLRVAHVGLQAPPYQLQLQQHQQEQRRMMMAGHNKWSKIRHKKGAKDVNRALIFGKASRSIIAASRSCGGDITNLRLQSAIAHAKTIQLPKDRIQDAIVKGTGGGGQQQQDLEQLRFDAMMNFAGQKVGCIITALTDNRNRTVQNVRAIVTKLGGEFLPTDKLSYLLEQVGLILVETTNSSMDDEDTLLECALDAGAINVELIEQDEDDKEEEEEDVAEKTALDSGKEIENDSSSDATHRIQFVVTTEEKDLWQVVTSLQESGFHVSQFEHRYVLVDQEHGGVSLSEEGTEQLEAFLEKLDENEDVTNVYHSATSSS